MLRVQSFHLHTMFNLSILGVYYVFPDPTIVPGARSAVQECAISIALMMFGLILEKFVQLLKDILAAAATTADCGFIDGDR